MRKIALLPAILLTLVCANHARAWEIKLDVADPTGQIGSRPIHGGVPLLAGQAKEVADLRLAVKDRDGKLVAIPAQFRVLARWWRADNSIRWILVDYSLADVPGEHKDVYLTDAKLDAPAPKQPVAVEDKGDQIVVSTGPAVFTIDKKKFNFLQSAVVDGQELLESSADLGTVIEDMFGERYYSSQGTREVVVQESGPMRVCVRARGQHLAREGKGYSRGMYGYDITMNFHAGSPDVIFDAVLTNNFAKSIGEPLMKDASLKIKLAGGATGCRVYGAAPVDAPLKAGQSVCLYQDSNGADTWQVCQSYTGNVAPGGTCFHGKTVSFRGYRIYSREDGKAAPDTQIGGGDQARGIMHIFNDRGGAVLFMRNFWQQFPKAVEASGDGVLRLGMFPRESLAPHYLDDCAAKGHEIVLHFYAKGKSHYAADEAGRTWPHVIADIWEPLAGPRPEIAHIAATGALTDVGTFTVPTSFFPDYNLAVNARRLFMTDEYLGNGYGWQVFGERWLSHGGHSTHGARQPIKEDNYLYKWFVSGGAGWLEAGNNRSRLFRDVRAYRIDDQDPLAFKNYAEFRNANTSESREWTHRAIPDDDELKKFREGLVPHARWEFPNPEHCTLDLLYDRYLLFGDQRAFEDMRTVVGHGAYFEIDAAPLINRSTGWSWRALERYWDLTGDKRCEELLNTTIAAYGKLAGKAPLWSGDAANPNVWFTQIFSRGAAICALHTGDAKALDICKELAIGKEDRADYFCTLFAVLYHLTGDQKYKDAVLAKTDGGRKLLVAADPGDFPATAHWLLNQPPKTK